jgi:hypothetical protein
VAMLSSITFQPMPASSLITFQPSSASNSFCSQDGPIEPRNSKCNHFGRKCERFTGRVDFGSHHHPRPEQDYGEVSDLSSPHRRSAVPLSSVATAPNSPCSATIALQLPAT